MKIRKYTGRTKKLTYGVGFIPKDYKVADKLTGFTCPFHRRWYSMLSRCYSERVHKVYPTYKDVTVCNEWHDFLTFKSWMESQDWEGKDLDKDILKALTGKNEYSPENCAFISRELNSFFTLRQNHRGEHPLGVHRTVSKKTGSVRYVARLNKPSGRISLGTYKTPSEAHRAWQKAKLDYGRELQELEENPRVQEALKVTLNKLEEDYDNGVETKSLL